MKKVKIFLLFLERKNGIKTLEKMTPFRDTAYCWLSKQRKNQIRTFDVVKVDVSEMYRF